MTESSKIRNLTDDPANFPDPGHGDDRTVVISAVGMTAARTRLEIQQHRPVADRQH
jgi:hypothetical protein